MNLRICSLCVLTLLTACGSDNEADKVNGPWPSDAADARDSGEASTPIGDSKCPNTCVRAITCVTHCGGPVVSSGCCACEAPTFDSFERCGSDSGSTTDATIDVSTVDQGVPVDSQVADISTSTGDLGVDAVSVDVVVAQDVATESGRIDDAGIDTGRADETAVDTGRIDDARTEDSRADEGQVADSTVVDTGVVDTGVVVDTAVPVDTGVEDTHIDQGVPVDVGAETASSLPAGVHGACVQGNCPAGLTAIFFDGIAGPSGPRFCTCEVPCALNPNVCPGTSKCRVATDGPGSVCHEAP